MVKEWHDYLVNKLQVMSAIYKKKYFSVNTVIISGVF